MPTFTAEIIISFSDLNHNESVIPKYSKMQGCTRFERFRKKKIQKKKKRKKKKRKKEKHQGLGLSHLLPAQGLQICGVSSINYEWSLLFFTRRASRGALTSSLFHFLFFFFVILHLRRTSPKGKGLLVVYQRQKCFLKHENHG